MSTAAMLLVAVLAQPSAELSSASTILPDCLVKLTQEAQVPAQEPGVLVDFHVRPAGSTLQEPAAAGMSEAAETTREGLEIKKGDVLARIDDAKPRLELRSAEGKLGAAQEKAKDDINVRYSIASYNVAVAELDFNLEANRKVPGSVPQVEINRLRLKVEETRLAIDKSKMDQRVAGHEAKVAEAEADAARENIHRRQIVSPLDGMVVEMRRHLGEWVQPGDMVLRIVRLDHLWVEGYVPVNQFSRGQLQDQPVTVRVALARGQTATFAGKIVYIDPTTQPGGRFRVRAEVENRKDAGTWVLSPGLNAEMTIHLR